MTEFYTKEEEGKLQNGYDLVQEMFPRLFGTISNFSIILTNNKAKEYFRFGIGRRLELAHHCFNQIFSIFPVKDCHSLLRKNKLDLTVFLQTYFIHIYGIIDNAALSVAYENNITPQRIKNFKHINIQRPEFIKIINPKLREYLTEKSFVDWYKKYHKFFRDTLAHRNPLYIPPGLPNANRQAFDDYNKQIARTTDPDQLCELYENIENLYTLIPWFANPSLENEPPIVLLHPQIIADFNTIEEFLVKVMKFFFVIDQNINKSDQMQKALKVAIDYESYSIQMKEVMEFTNILSENWKEMEREVEDMIGDGQTR